MRLKWKHLFLIAIVTSALIGSAGGMFVLRHDISPREFLQELLSRRDTNNSPMRTAEAYLAAWENVQPEKMYAQLSKEERSATDLKTYQQDLEEFPLRPIKHKGLTWNRTGNKAFVKILVTWPTMDGEPMQKEEFMTLVKDGASWKVSEKDSFK